MDKLVELFTEDAVWEMPPFDGWYQGRRRTSSRCQQRTAPPRARATCGSSPSTANGQPAAALYMLNRETGVHEAFQLHVLDVRPERHLARGGVPRHASCSRNSACLRRSRHNAL